MSKQALLMLHTVMGNGFSVADFVRNEIQTNSHVDENVSASDNGIGNESSLSFFDLKSLNFKVIYLTFLAFAISIRW